MTNLDIDKNNNEKYLQLLAQIDPELYLIKIALVETGLNPMILPKIIRSISNLVIGSGYGKIQIFMQAKVVTQVKGEEAVNVNEPASIKTET